MPTPRVRARKISLPSDQPSRSGSRSGRRRRPRCGPARPAGRQVLLEAADPVEHVVHPAAGDLLHHRLQRLALAERVEDRRDRAELDRVGAEEHQVVEHPVQLGEQRAHPDRPYRHLHAEHPLDGEHDAELVGERRQPVVPVGQHDDLPVVADLEELLGAAVHVADDRARRDDPLAVEVSAQPQHAVRRRVLRADVEHHVGRRQVGGVWAGGCRWPVPEAEGGVPALSRGRPRGGEWGGGAGCGWAGPGGRNGTWGWASDGRTRPQGGSWGAEQGRNHAPGGGGGPGGRRVAASPYRAGERAGPPPATGGGGGGPPAPAGAGGCGRGGVVGGPAPFPGGGPGPCPGVLSAGDRGGGAWCLAQTAARSGDQGAQHDDRGVVDVLESEAVVPGNRKGRPREHGDDRRDDDLDDGHRSHPLVLVAEGPVAGCETVSGLPAQVDRDGERQVQPNDADRHDCEERHRDRGTVDVDLDQRGSRDDQCHDHRQVDAVDGHPVGAQL